MGRVFCRVACDNTLGRYPWPWSVDAIEPDLRGEVHQHHAAGGHLVPRGQWPRWEQRSGLRHRLNAHGSVKPDQS
jgi:hypothetical protein